MVASSRLPELCDSFSRAVDGSRVLGAELSKSNSECTHNPVALRHRPRDLHSEFRSCRKGILSTSSQSQSSGEQGLKLHRAPVDEEVPFSLHDGFMILETIDFVREHVIEDVVYDSELMNGWLAKQWLAVPWSQMSSPCCNWQTFP